MRFSKDVTVFTDYFLSVTIHVVEYLFYTAISKDMFGCSKVLYLLILSIIVKLCIHYQISIGNNTVVWLW